MSHRPILLTSLAASLLLAACGSDSTSTPPAASASADANVLFSSNRLASVALSSPAGLGALGTITGLTVGDTLVSIDRRPQNGYLYGLGYNATAGSVQLYVIHPETLVATAVGTTGTFVNGGGTAVAIGNSSTSTRFEVDFNPSVDRVRVVSSIGENFRLDPNSGAFVDGNLGGAAGSVTGLNMDGAVNIAAVAATAQGTAYTNNTSNNGGITTQYTLDEQTDRLYIQNPPNEGTLSAPQNLSPVLFTVLGFDIAPGVNAAASNTAVSSGVGVAVIKQSGGVTESLARIDLTNGSVSNITAIGSGGITGLAIQKPSAAAIVALSSSGTNLLRFASATPGTVTTVAITGVTAGETLVGMDYRPATGQLFAFGSDATANTGSLYRLDPQSGAATLIGTASSIAFVDTLGNAVDLPVTGYGFNFNPAVDRIRVTTSSGLNLRLNPNTGAPVDGDLGGTAGSIAGTNTDTGLNGVAASATGAAYTNSVAGTTVTTLYALDALAHNLYIQSPPNAGTLTSLLPIKLAGSTLNFTAPAGFDIQSQVRVTGNNLPVSTGVAYAALTVAGSTHLYTINLVTGAATDLGAIGAGATGIAALTVGQTHVQ